MTIVSHTSNHNYNIDAPNVGLKINIVLVAHSSGVTWSHATKCTKPSTGSPTIYDLNFKIKLNPTRWLDVYICILHLSPTHVTRSICYLTFSAQISQWFQSVDRFADISQSSLLSDFHLIYSFELCFQSFIIYSMYLFTYFSTPVVLPFHNQF